jgi:hypothetical protein
MKRSTALSRLRDVVEALDRAATWPETTVTAAFVFGDLLDAPSGLERVEVALVVDESPESVPWLSRPSHLEALADSLRFTKLPMTWRWRPAEWPVWNHAITSALRIWTTDGGSDPAALNALVEGNVGETLLEAPTDTRALLSELRTERDVGRQHLAFVTDSFHDREWRRIHRGFGVYPEDHLWSAVAGFLDLDDAIRRLES